MNSDFDPEWAPEPQWKVTYTPQRISASNTAIRDRSLPPTSWYLTPWEADAALGDGSDFAHLVHRGDPRLPHSVSAHIGPAVVTLTCTRCGRTGAAPDDFNGHPCADADNDATAEPTTPTYVDPSCKEAWLAAARSGSLVDGIDSGWPSRDTDALDPWTVELAFDIKAYSRDHAQQIADLLALITGGRISGIS